MKLSLLSAIALAQRVLGEAGISQPVPGAIQLGFDVYRGSDKTDLLKRDQLPAYLVKRDGSATMDLENMQTFYMTNLKIGGTDPVGVLVDTGSLDLWVMSHDIICEASSSSGLSKALKNMEVLFDSRIEENEDTVTSEEDEIKEDDVTPTPSNDIVNKAYYTTIILSDFPSGGNPYATATASGSGSGSGAGSVSQTNTCTEYGSFNTAGSDSFKVNSSANPFSIAYADGTLALGFWGYDNVEIGNSSTTVDNLSFAVVNDTSSNVGVLGIGLPGLETTYLSRNGGGYQYENLPLKMRNQGLINKSAYSLYLGQETDTYGHILFGAVDHAKYSGSLVTVPIVNTQKLLGYQTAIRIEVVLDLVVVDGGSNLTVTNNAYAALLDTGSTLSYFPTELLSKFANMVGAKYSASYGAYMMLCPLSDNNVNVTLNFSGQTIVVPFSALALQLTSSQCALGVLPQSSDYILFGDNVLRSMYVVYDLEDLELSLAQVKYTNDTDIEVISSNVPSATRAALYSSTALSSASEGSATARISYSSGSSTRGSSSHKSGGALFGVLFMVLIGGFFGVAVL